MLRTAIAIVLFGAASLPTVVSAQDTKTQWQQVIRSNCGKELKAYCAGVPEGRGRLVACLYARENKLSAKCGEAVSASLERLGTALGALANVQRVCEPDARRLCNGMVAGNGNLVGCLTTAKRSVSAQCNATLDAAFLRP